MFFCFDDFGREERQTCYLILSPREYALQKREKKSFGKVEEGLGSVYLLAQITVQKKLETNLN